MEIINNNDIQSILNEFITDLSTLLAWRHTCRKNMKIKYWVSLNNMDKKNIINSNSNIFKYEEKKPYIHNMFNVIYIDTLPYYFDDSYLLNFKYLMYLNCSYNNKISDKSIQTLHNLSVLICNNTITDNSVANLNNLVSLKLCENDSITDISLMKLTKLEQLIINNSCKNISDISILLLTNLTELNLYSNRFCHITNESISKLSKLKVLSIHNNPYINTINLPYLKRLYANELLTDSSTTCSNLTHLYCSDNQNFTDSLLCKLPNLLSLNCEDNNNFTNNGLYSLPNLTYLDCGFNTNFTDDGLMTLSNLKTLYCSYNFNFTNKSLPYLPKLIILSCGSNNNFTARGILNLKNLEELFCFYGRSNINIIDLKPLNKLRRVNGMIFRKN